ncbi:HAD family hydrolase [Paenibacillus sp. NPDC058174]|uniref:HAD family hydrolase n=1 Tax=Paenibacillus sp. NPDC058174 TaxID=3346366 RepID=UPI0036DD5286
MSIKVVLFDFDGTLADTLPLSFIAFKTVFKQYDNRDVTNDELIAMFGPTAEYIIGENFKDKVLVQQAIEDYYSLYEKGHFDDFQNDQGIVGLLHFLKEKGIKIGVITGKSKRAFQISSEALHLLSFFDITITGDDVDKAKPDPEGINKALNILGIDKSDALFVGDSNADILAGKAAGVRTYGVRWLSTYQSLVYDVSPDGIFDSVTEFRELLEKESVIHGN